MIAPHEKCVECGESAERTLGAVAYCDDCAEGVLAPLRAKHGEPRVGRGRRHGRRRPDFGADDFELRCDACGATWVGPVRERCDYCRRSIDNMRRWQGELVLRPPEYDLDDARRDPALRGWGDRLAVAVEAGLIDEHVARRVWDKEVRRDVA